MKHSVCKWSFTALARSNNSLCFPQRFSSQLRNKSCALMQNTYTHYAGHEFTCASANCDILDRVNRYSSLFKYIKCIAVNLKEREHCRVRSTAEHYYGFSFFHTLLITVGEIHTLHLTRPNWEEPWAATVQRLWTDSRFTARALT